MRRLSCALLATTAVVTLAIGQVAQGGWYDRCSAACKQSYENFKRDFNRNNCWPEPFVRPDRLHVQRPLELMVAQGWQQQNTLGNHHFAPDSSQLTTAGQLKVREILVQSPPPFRTVFVQQGGNPQDTASRVAAVQQWASQHLPDGFVADVRETHLIVEGRPADAVDMINVRFQQTQPAPQLRAASPEESEL